MFKYSFVVPVYNAEKYLEKCIGSIISQNYDGAYEIIMVDDGSTDSSGQLCEEIKERNPQKSIKVIHQENKGLGGARNTGIMAAQGEYLFFVDSDDSISLEALKKLDEFAEKTDCDIISFNLLRVDEDGNELYTIKAYNEDGAVSSIKEKSDVVLTDHSACDKIIKRKLFIESGVRFPERLWFEDLATIPKLYLFADKMGYMSESFYYYLQRKGSIMNSAKCKKNIDIVTAVESITSFYKDKNLFEKYYSEFEYMAALNIYYLASIRVMNIDPKSELLDEFREYMQNNFSDYKSNKYLSKKELTVIKLLDKKMYSAVKMVFKIKGIVNKIRK